MPPTAKELRLKQINADLEAMTAMIDATLDYFRGLREDENIQLIDIDALLQSLAEDATNTAPERAAELTDRAVTFTRIANELHAAAGLWRSDSLD